MFSNIDIGVAAGSISKGPDGMKGGAERAGPDGFAQQADKATLHRREADGVGHHCRNLHAQRSER